MSSYKAVWGSPEVFLGSRKHAVLAAKMLFKGMREFHMLGLCKQRPNWMLHLTEKLLSQHITASGPSAGKLAETTAFSSARTLTCAGCGG